MLKTLISFKPLDSYLGHKTFTTIGYELLSSHSSPFTDSRRTVVIYCENYVHKALEVLVNFLGNYACQGNVRAVTFQTKVRNTPVCASDTKVNYGDIFQGQKTTLK